MNTEFKKAAEDAFTPTFSELVSGISINKIEASGTSLSIEEIAGNLEFITRAFRTTEDSIRSGGRNWSEREQLNKGIIALLDNSGGRAMTVIVESIAEAAGYRGELHCDITTPTKMPILLYSNPMKAGQIQVTLLHPLPDARVLGPKGEVWQAAAFRVIGGNQGTFGLAYIKQAAD